MDAKQHLFYGLGQVAYAVAQADGKIQRQEREKLHDMLTDEFTKIDTDYGYADIIFQLLEKEHMDFEHSYKWGIDAIKLGSHKLNSKLKWDFTDILFKVAAAYPPSTRSEEEIIFRFIKDIKGLR
ncbi:MAG TPA: hypothetical protein VD905_13895 [Flavobacteriales bacterium]|nr:hypothetical protein [Flavobacteriales bacterium]